MELQKMFIDGSWVEGSGGKSAPTYNPANGEILAMMTEGTEEDVKKAVAAAKKSFYETREWRDMDVQVRSDMILKIADAIEAEKDVFAKLDCLDLGKPLREAEADVDDAIHCFRYYAGAMKTPCGGYYEVNEGFGKMHTYTIHEPVGVCGLITPWNYPLLMGVWKLAPALAAGNSVVFKPSSNCVLSSVHLFEIFEKVGLPKGCANLVLGPGSVVGNTLAESEDVDMITFTGSTEVGQSIMRAAAGNIKKIGLELGGKSPNVIFADADLDGAVEWAMIGIFLNQGEDAVAEGISLLRDLCNHNPRHGTDKHLLILNEIVHQVGAQVGAQDVGDDSRDLFLIHLFAEGSQYGGCDLLYLCVGELKLTEFGRDCLLHFGKQALPRFSGSHLLLEDCCHILLVEHHLGDDRLDFGLGFVSLSLDDLLYLAVEIVALEQIGQFRSEFVFGDVICQV